MVFRPSLRVLLPLAILVIAGSLMIPRGHEPPAENPAHAESAGNDGAADWIVTDFTLVSSLDKLDGWDVRRGRYVATGGALEQQPEPMVEGKVLWPRAIRSAGGLRVQMSGAGARRASPRFCIGLHSDREFQLRFLPDQGRVDFAEVDLTLANESILTSAPFSNAKTGEAEVWMELTVQPGPAAGETKFEGRLWANGSPRPADAVVSHVRTGVSGPFYAAIEGAPYALKPIRIIRAEVRSGE